MARLVGDFRTKHQLGTILQHRPAHWAFFQQVFQCVLLGVTAQGAAVVLIKASDGCGAGRGGASGRAWCRPSDALSRHC